MARRKKFKFSGFLGMLVGIIATVGVGGLFIDGAMLNVVILKSLPLIVHQVVGWSLIVGALLSLLAYFMDN